MLSLQMKINLTILPIWHGMNMIIIVNSWCEYRFRVYCLCTFQHALLAPPRHSCCLQPWWVLPLLDGLQLLGSIYWHSTGTAREFDHKWSWMHPFLCNSCGVCCWIAPSILCPKPPPTYDLAFRVTTRSITSSSLFLYAAVSPVNAVHRLDFPAWKSPSIAILIVIFWTNVKRNSLALCEQMFFTDIFYTFIL